MVAAAAANAGGDSSDPATAVVADASGSAGATAGGGGGASSSDLECIWSPCKNKQQGDIVPNVSIVKGPACSQLLDDLYHFSF